MPLIRDIAEADCVVAEELLYSNDLGDGRSYYPGDLDVIVAELCGSVVGVAEFRLDYDFGHDKGREAHPGKQAFVLTMAVAHTDRRRRIGRALLTEIAHRAQEAGLTFLALVPQDGDGEADRQAFFQACGLTRYGPNSPGAAWGCPVSEVLVANAVGVEES
ncbi:GNAT family N-acetyltransferase [Streptomyces hirsutus]|uniref:GNAT family N-acetyltransferase n=1 Tax=Streptomyces hirsutus TaxID=35620 RepID=A0ABZ1H084_9ACTN|nr:GNAT family N-acetyltransferase [Streptomyces hirsutus]WSD11216.1 GNAT family N-acetyltransferase [Streptomyces hirsutus]WTD15429.1 GNAT family N-acetyltransferase [Streptomyces hirsutus]WTD22326.1 GNAT family N-acetyltransferase [Streptomyces hirsutus]